MGFTDPGKYPLQNLTEQIIELGIKIHRELGCGFLEIVYKDALEFEFKSSHIPYSREKEFQISYNGIILPHKFYADFIVFESLILEVKAKEGFAEIDLARTINYLKCSGCKIGLLLNFGKTRLQIKRVIF